MSARNNRNRRRSKRYATRKHVTNLQIANDMNDLEGSIGAYLNQIQRARSTKSNVDYYNRTRDDLVSKRDRYQSRIDALDFEYENADSIIAESQREIIKLRKELKRTEHRAAIEKLKDLKRQVDEMLRGEGQDDD